MVESTKHNICTTKKLFTYKFNAMAHNIHLESLEHVCLLAKQQAQLMKEDQSVYKTKDQYKYEIFAFAPTESFGGKTVRVVRYTREDKHETVLQDSGNKQPDVTGKATGTSKKAARKADK